jgi:hypothetical protein
MHGSSCDTGSNAGRVQLSLGVFRRPPILFTMTPDLIAAFRAYAARKRAQSKFRLMREAPEARRRHGGIQRMRHMDPVAVSAELRRRLTTNPRSLCYRE